MRKSFSPDVTETSGFYSLPTKSQILYFRFGMYSLPGGQVRFPRTIMRGSGFSESDLQPLIKNGYVSVRNEGFFVAMDAKTVKKFKERAD